MALAIGALLFLRVGVLYTVWTGHGATDAGLAATTASGLGNLRVFAGSFHLGVAFVAITGLVRPHFATPALTVLAIITGTVVATRWIGYLAGAPLWLLPTAIETGAEALFVTALWASRRRVAPPSSAARP